VIRVPQFLSIRHTILRRPIPNNIAQLICQLPRPVDCRIIHFRILLPVNHHQHVWVGVPPEGGLLAGHRADFGEREIFEEHSCAYWVGMGWVGVFDEVVECFGGGDQVWQFVGEGFEVVSVAWWDNGILLGKVEQMHVKRLSYDGKIN
jgi:hypothetical protein